MCRPRRGAMPTPSRRGDGGGGGGGGGTHVAVISETQRRLHKRARAANAANAAASADVAAGGYELCQVLSEPLPDPPPPPLYYARESGPYDGDPLAVLERRDTSVTPLPGGAASSSSVCVVRYIGWQRWANLSPRCSRTMLWLNGSGLSRPCARRGRAHAAAAAAAGRRRWCPACWCCWPYSSALAAAAHDHHRHHPRHRRRPDAARNGAAAAASGAPSASPTPTFCLGLKRAHPVSAAADAPCVYHPPGALAKPSRPSSAQAKLRSGPMGASWCRSR